MRITHDTGPLVSRFRPIYLMHEEGLEPSHLQAVLDATHAVLHIAGVDRHIEINNFGVWRTPSWLNGEILTAWNSIDWYLAHAKRVSRKDGQLHVGHLLKLLYNEPWQKATGGPAARPRGWCEEIPVVSFFLLPQNFNPARIARIALRGRLALQ